MRARLYKDGWTSALELAREGARGTVALSLLFPDDAVCQVLAGVCTFAAYSERGGLRLYPRGQEGREEVG